MMVYHKRLTQKNRQKQSEGATTTITKCYQDVKLIEETKEQLLPECDLSGNPMNQLVNSVDLGSTPW